MASSLNRHGLFMPMWMALTGGGERKEVAYVSTIVVSAFTLKRSRKLLMGIGYSDVWQRGGGKSTVLLYCPEF